MNNTTTIYSKVNNNEYQIQTDKPDNWTTIHGMRTHTPLKPVRRKRVLPGRVATQQTHQLLYCVCFGRIVFAVDVIPDSLVIVGFEKKYTSP